MFFLCQTFNHVFRFPAGSVAGGRWPFMKDSFQEIENQFFTSKVLISSFKLFDSCSMFSQETDIFF